MPMGDIHPPKITKASANYHEAKKGGDHCGICKHFEQIEPRHCSKVEGIIEPQYWCRLFEPEPAKANGNR